MTEIKRTNIFTVGSTYIDEKIIEFKTVKMVTEFIKPDAQGIFKIIIKIGNSTPIIIESNVNDKVIVNTDSRQFIKLPE